MNKSCRLQRVIGPLILHIRAGQASKVVVDKLEQLAGSSIAAIAHPVEQNSYFVWFTAAHRLDLRRIITKM
jgi:hypothetical protein